MEPALAEKTYGIIGLGLMGGSFAFALRDEVLGEKGRIFALDEKKAALDHACESGIIDKGFLPGEAPVMLSLCNIVFICLYPSQTIDFLLSNAPFFQADSIVTDISGVKSALEHCLPHILENASFDFISGHPMAGSEKEGFLHAQPAIFRGRNYILLPSPRNRRENLALLKTLIRKIGFNRIIETDAATHDRKIAFTSQLCHIIAAALVDSAEDVRITEFGGGSFEDLTRIAMINAPLWTELFISNKTELLPHIEKFEKALKTYKQLLQTENTGFLRATLAEVRKKRMEMGYSTSAG
ncbi:MAG: prephenate dehydrogenase [Spirochaetaceae bacterium]|nr:prephenate dehydrogenase [Spirochaetaceae bacterium]